VVGYGPFSLWVIHKEGLCPSSGDINRLMMMMRNTASVTGGNTSVQIAVCLRAGHEDRRANGEVAGGIQQHGMGHTDSHFCKSRR
jgi:hypothetical protein